MECTSDRSRRSWISIVLRTEQIDGFDIILHREASQLPELLLKADKNSPKEIEATREVILDGFLSSYEVVGYR